MPINLNDPEYFADTISKRIDQLLNERQTLRQELSRRTDGGLEQEKSFVRAFQEGILAGAIASDKTARLEHILAAR